jgi:hypothetical protein
MNGRLAEFLMSLIRQPDWLSSFNEGGEARDRLLEKAELSEADKAALRSDDAATLLRQLQVGEGDEVTWVMSPPIKKFTVGFAIKMMQPGAPIKAVLAGGLPIKEPALGVARKGPAAKPKRATKAGAGKKKSGGAAPRRSKTSARGSTRKRR